MEDTKRQPITTLESEFRREEGELRTWLNENVSDPAVRKQHLERLRADHVARGRRLI